MSQQVVVRQMILKVAQHCNFNCAYCYVYNMGDVSWQRRPKLITTDIVLAVARRIVEHLEQFDLPTFHVEIHGGEPLLLGLSRMRELLQILISHVGRPRLHFSLQTNGLLLSDAWVDLFSEYGVRVGVSLDGPPSKRSLRLDHRGHDTTSAVLERLKSLRINRPAFSPGVLAVLSDHSDVEGLITWFPENGFHSFDLLLPLGNYVVPPIGLTDQAALAKKLCRGFDVWYAMGKEAPEVRFFELILSGLMGYEVTLDAFGGDLRHLCVVESDGSLGANDVIRYCGGEHSLDTLNILTSPLSVHAEAFQLERLQSLCAKCRNCEMVNGCGGGYLPDRFDGHSFDNPSAYCDLLWKVCNYVYNRVARDFPPTALVRGVRPGLQLD